MGIQGDPKKRTRIIQYKNDQCTFKELDVIRELPLTLVLGEIEILTLLYNGQNPKELVLGFLFSERIVSQRQDVLSVDFNPKTLSVSVNLVDTIDVSDKISRKRTITSGCGKGSSFYNMMDHIAEGGLRIDSPVIIEPDRIYQLSKEVYRSSELYRTTHGVHSAALCDSEKIIMFREDIGRHNAVDKIAGRCLMDDVITGDKILFTTGRLTSEVIIKAGRLGCPIVISRSSATALALKLAGQINMTVIGGAKALSFHVYCGEQRVKGEPDDCAQE